MAQLDKIHDAVKNALIKDGWTITADPYRIEFEESGFMPTLLPNDRLRRCGRMKKSSWKSKVF